MDSDIRPRLAYGSDKSVDRNPEIKAAGNLTNFGTTVADCLFIDEREPYGYVKRFLKSNIYPIGHSTQLPSRVNDPCVTICNGVATHPSEPAVNLLYPAEITKLQSIQNEIREKNSYPRRKYQDVGKVANYNIDPGSDVCQSRCGKTNKKSVSVEELLHYPPELMKDCGCKRHQIKINRHYNEHFKPLMTFPLDGKINHFSDGRTMNNVLYHNSLHERFASVPFGLEEFRQRNIAKLGESLQPNCDSGVALIDPDFTFGVQQDSSISIDQLLAPKIDEDKRTEESLINILNSIEKSGFSQFDQLRSRFKYFDKSKTGKISVDNLKQACRDLNLPLTTAQFKSLLQLCELVSPGGTVDYIKFYRIVNPDETVIDRGSESFEGGMTEAKSRYDKGEIKQVNPLLSLNLAIRNTLTDSKFPRHDPCATPKADDGLNNKPPPDPVTQKVIDIMTELNVKKTTLQEINSDVSDYDFNSYRTFGHLTTRTDHPPPDPHKIGDTTEYGDDSDAYCCLYPSIYTQGGVSKRDMLKPRMKNELWDLYKKVYESLTYDQFSTLYKVAAKESGDGCVSVEGIKQLIKEFDLKLL